MISFAVQKLVSLIRSPLFIFAFISIALGDWSKNTLVQFMSENILPLFSSRSFMVSYLIFKSLSHLSLFLCVMRGCVLTSLIYIWLSNFPNTTCRRDCLFSIVYSCLHCQRLIDHKSVGLFLGSLFCSFDPCLFLCWYHTVLITVALFVVFVWSLGGWCLQLCSFSSGLPWQFWILWFHIRSSDFVKWHPK